MSQVHQGRKGVLMQKGQNKSPDGAVEAGRPTGIPGEFQNSKQRLPGAEPQRGPGSLCLLWGIHDEPISCSKKEKKNLT